MRSAASFARSGEGDAFRSDIEMCAGRLWTPAGTVSAAAILPRDRLAEIEIIRLG
jgi:hypothetical protein